MSPPDSHRTYHSLRDAYEQCEHGDWMLWWLERLNVAPDECASLAYWCAERTRQNTLLRLPTSVRDRLMSLEPAVDRNSAIQMADASVWAADAARTALDALVESRAIADEVRRRIPWSVVEAGLVSGSASTTTK